MYLCFFWNIHIAGVLYIRAFSQTRKFDIPEPFHQIVRKGKKKRLVGVNIKKALRQT